MNTTSAKANVKKAETQNTKVTVKSVINTNQELERNIKTVNVITTKNKEVKCMTTITKYIAIDGTEFDFEHDCVNYEINLNKPDDNELILIDKNGIRLLNTPKGLEECMYIKIENEKALEWVERISDDYGYYSLDSIGCFYYDTNDNMWYEVNDILTKARHIIEAFDLKFME